ncbi:MAG: fibronectin type III domain-containing protein [Lachnospiraceae bacterium]|nr:fibronectin type III domain-containing protein [Lachnospiraceae bacterium]
MKYSVKKMLAVILVIGLLAGLVSSVGSYKVMAAKTGSEDQQSNLSDPEKQFKKDYPKLQTLADNGTIGLKFETKAAKDTITLGRYRLFDRMYASYPKDEADDIEWEVLEYSEDKKSAFVISKNILVRYQFYAEETDDTDWEHADVRKWLNNDFINEAFSDSERALIKTTTVKTPDYYDEEDDLLLEGGNDTEDKLFLLSKDELDKYFPPIEKVEDFDYDDYEVPSRICRYIGGGAGYWLLRSPGWYEGEVAVVTSDGGIISEGKCILNGVRPAFWINLTPELIEENNLSVGSSAQEQADVYVTFGNYDIPDKNGNGDGNKDKLEWLICDYDEKENKALLLSRNLVRSMPFKNEEDDNLWETSDVRAWLNGVFYFDAFSSDEAARIKNYTINDQDTKNVKNKVFIFSLDETNKYLPDYDMRLASYNDGQMSSWWTRTPGESAHNVVEISKFGVQEYYYECTAACGVRPAIYIDMDPKLSAENLVPETPEISAEPASDGMGIVVAAEKTYDAEGYEIYIKNPGASEFESAAVIDRNGSTKRSTIVRNLLPGEYTVKVKAFRKNGKKTVYSSFSKEDKVELNGYSDAEYVSENYPKLKALADKGLISFSSEYGRDTIKLGKWDNKDIEWEVLEYSADGKSALIMSENILCKKLYNEEDKSITWKDCSLRKWLNEDFINSAFKKSEKKLIKKTKITNENNRIYGTKGGKATKDKVFLLSISEYEKYVEDSNKNGLINRNIGLYTNGDSGYYWLRTPGDLGSTTDFEDWDEEDWEDYEPCDYQAGYAAFVFDDGEIEWNGSGVAYEKLGVRPVMWIKLTDKIISKNKLSVKDNKSIANLYVVFGTQEYDNSSDLLEWQILDYDEKNNKALLLSRYLVGSERYMDTGNTLKDEDVTWADSTIRQYLNDNFYNSVFSKAEKSLIKKVKIKNPDNKKMKTKGGKNTSDRIFLLSISEVEKYFSENPGKGSISRVGRFRNGDAGEWWLRSPGISQASASYVTGDGKILGNYHTANFANVRPAIWIDLSK